MINQLFCILKRSTISSEGYAHRCKITSELLYKVALVFALMDAVYVPLLVWAGIWSSAIGSLTHIWAIYLGIVTKPPMLQEASPLAAGVIAFFEYMFYCCTILVIAKFIDWAQMMLRH